MKKIEYIDFAKGFAILTIILYHYFQKLELGSLMEQAISFGGTGVHLFFFISGVGLSLSLVKKPLEFYKRRLFKILLPYYLFVTVAFIFSLISPVYKEFGWKEYLSHIFLYKMFVESATGSFGYHLWFISTIIQFYIVFPFLVVLRNKTGNILFMAICLLISVSWWLIVYFSGHTDFRIWNSFFLQYLWEFALGMVLSKYINSDILKHGHLGWVTLLSIISIFLVIMIVTKFGNYGKVFNDIPSFIGYTAVSVLVYSLCQKLPDIFKNSMLWIGKYSFSIYLVHILLLLFYLELLKTFQLSFNLVHILFLLFITGSIGFLFQKSYSKFQKN